jgi:hypothetical protein
MPAPLHRPTRTAAADDETRKEEHDRLQHRTDELKEEHGDLALDRRPFDQGEHDAHNADLAEHKRNLAAHRVKTAADPSRRQRTTTKRKTKT